MSHPFEISSSSEEESHPLSDTLGRAFGPDVHEGQKQSLALSHLNLP